MRRIRVIGEPVLRTKAVPVVDFDRELERLVADMAETMIDANGAGLAAPQVGVGLRVFTYVDIDPETADTDRVRHLVNPVLGPVSVDEVEDEEGCLSVPGLYFPLARPQRVVAKGFDVHGEPLTVEGTDRLARCLAHETDHLDGVLFLDRLDAATRKEAMRQLREQALESGQELVVKRSPHPPLG